MFQLRNCRLLKAGIDNPLTILDAHYGEIRNNTIGDAQSTELAEIAMGHLLRVRVWENTMAVRWIVFEDSQHVWMRKNHVTCVPDAVYLVQSKRGAMNAFDANVLNGRTRPRTAF